jgi:hypothetical protein
MGAVHSGIAARSLDANRTAHLPTVDRVGSGVRGEPDGGIRLTQRFRSGRTIVYDLRDKTSRWTAPTWKSPSCDWEAVFSAVRAL